MSRRNDTTLKPRMAAASLTPTQVPRGAVACGVTLGIDCFAALLVRGIATMPPSLSPMASG